MIYQAIRTVVAQFIGQKERKNARSHNKSSYLVGLKEVIEKAIERIVQVNGVEIDYWTAMPNHLHLILTLSDCDISLGEIVRRFKAIVSKEAGLKVWQPNYYEHVIRNDQALMRIRQYIQNNPLEEKIEFEQFYK
ncbi:MAG: transposase [Actinobacteria bacterium]|nr:transposase [Actinomycetota bacterium]